MSKEYSNIRLSSQTILRAAACLALALFICLFAAQSASAANFVVTTTADSGAGSLRAAIATANTNAQADTITFNIASGSAGCTDLVCTITLTSGELAVIDDGAGNTLTINAAGTNQVTISGNNTSRVFFVKQFANLTLNGLTITKGNGTGTTNSLNNNSGGGIISFGTLTLTNSTVSGNSTRFGGGIDSDNGITTLTNSTVSGNTATNFGGGIYKGGAAAMTLVNSTVSGNTAFSGGGIYNTGNNHMTLTNSTVSGNTAEYVGGIQNDASTLNLTSVTVTKNQSTLPRNCGANCIGGISTSFGTVNLKNTIVAGNTVADATSSPDFRGSIAAGSAYNLIGNGQGMGGIANNDANHNQVGVDAKLAPLANNGGATQTHALLFGSPALDKGSSFTLTTDQRGAGFTRPVNLPDATYPNATGGNGADIGAFEAALGTTAATVSVSGRVVTAQGRGIRNVVITMMDSSGNTRTATSTAFGYYRFEEVEAGQVYIFTARGKRFSFDENSQVHSIIGDTNDINFVASERTVFSVN